MRFSDVKVIIDLTKPSKLLGFGKPLILGSKEGGFAYKTYADLETVKADFGESAEEYKMAERIFAQGDYAPEKIAIACADSTTGVEQTLAAKLAEVIEEDWYFLLSTTDVKEDIITLGDAIEANNYRIFVTRSSTAADLTEYKAKKWDRTVVMVHNEAETAKYPDAALVGAVGSRTVGSVTWKSKKLVGIAPNDITPSELNTIHDNNCITYVEKAGDYVTSEGWCTSGEYIDVIHAKDYVTNQMQYELQKAINSQPKISFDSNGIALLQSVCTSVLAQAFNQGVIAADDGGTAMYSVKFLPRSQVPAGERAVRKYTGGSFSFNLAGAIHNVEVKGQILV